MVDGSGQCAQILISAQLVNPFWGHPMQILFFSPIHRGSHCPPPFWAVDSVPHLKIMQIRDVPLVRSDDGPEDWMTGRLPEVDRSDDMR